MALCFCCYILRVGPHRSLLIAVSGFCVNLRNGEGRDFVSIVSGNEDDAQVVVAELVLFWCIEDGGIEGTVENVQRNTICITYNEKNKTYNHVNNHAVQTLSETSNTETAM